MLSKYFDINDNGCSIRCKIYTNDINKIENVILFGHGFGGHRDAHAAERFAEVCLSKHKTAALITFDWPCHGSDARNKLTLDACESYIDTVISYIKERFAPKELYGYATSFGGYQFLRYIHRHGSPFTRLVLRCPAIDMHYVLTHVMSEDERAKLEKGKEVLTGFDRKVKISKDFVDELSREQVKDWEYFDYADDILILHGSEDEIVPFHMVKEFADNNVIEFVAVEGVDHRFRNPKKMDLANSMMIKYLQLS